MQTIVVSIVVMMLSVAGLGIGVMLGRPPIKGSCGGLNCGLAPECAACPRHSGETGS